MQHCLNIKKALQAPLFLGDDRHHIPVSKTTEELSDKDTHDRRMTVMMPLDLYKTIQFISLNTRSITRSVMTTAVIHYLHEYLQHNEGYRLPSEARRIIPSRLVYYIEYQKNVTGRRRNTSPILLFQNGAVVKTSITCL